MRGYAIAPQDRDYAYGRGCIPIERAELVGHLVIELVLDHAFHTSVRSIELVPHFSTRSEISGKL
jgi:hypothetical protein